MLPSSGAASDRSAARSVRVATAPSGGTIHLDGVAKATPAVYDTLVGLHHTIEARDQAIGTTNYTFDSWSDGGARAHTITVPPADTTLTATLKAVPSTAPPAFVQVRAAERERLRDRHRPVGELGLGRDQR